MKNIFELIFNDTNSFIKFGTEHNIILIFCLLFGIYFIWAGKKMWNEEQKRQYALILCYTMIFLQFIKPFIKWGIGNFNVVDDLPLHLCNLMPLALAVAYYKRSRFIWAIFLFWIIAGSSQSLITPTLTEVLPHYEAIRYWTVHAGIVILVLYGAIVFKWKLKWSDILWSDLAMHIAAAIIYPTNVLLGSNYFYLNAKPPGTTFYTLLPDWPYYILHLEWIMLLLFILVFLIFKGIELIVHAKENKTP